ncbi:MAG: anion permease [Acidobacteria bacterium]|nr:anion permease [Acidobacteriota bacterium]
MEHSEPFPRMKIVGAAIGILAFLVLWFAPLGLQPRAQHGLAIVAFMVIFWIVEVTPHAMTGLIGCWLFWALKVVPADIAFRGFSSENPWFLLGALFVGAMVTESGLARRLAYTILSHIGTSYPRILLGFILTDFLMTFMIPAGPPRVILLGTIVLGVVASFGLDKKSNVAKAMILAITFSATLFDKSIIASTPSILARSLIEKFGHVPVYWSHWFIAYLPLDVINILAAWWLMLRLYPPEKNELPGGKIFLRQQLAALGPWSAREKRAAFWALVALSLWATDFLHHISPAVIGLGTGLGATLPRIGVLRAEEAKKVNFFIVIFMGAAISMAEAMRDTKALDVVTDVLFQFMAPYVHNVLQSTVVLYWSAFVAHLVLASETSMVAISMPLVMNFALKNELDPLAMGMVWSFATGGKLFIYQSLVLIAGYSFGSFEARDVFKIGLFFLIAESILLLLVVPYYWPLIGIG